MDESVIINVADAPALSHGRRATVIRLEPEDAQWRWAFLHCPAGTEHVFVGAGQEPCAVLMIGSRREYAPHYTVNELAAKYDASVQRETDDPAEAYADWREEPWRPTQLTWPLD